VLEMGEPVRAVIEGSFEGANGQPHEQRPTGEYPRPPGDAALYLGVRYMFG
jgi:hypothetical protein